MRRIFLAGLIGILSACAPASQKIQADEIDVDSLIASQVQLLQSGHVALTKVATMASRTDTAYARASTNWREELEVFRELGAIHQKLYRGTYRIEDPLDDPHSNLRIRRLTHDEAPLRVLEIYYQNELSRIREIKGILEEANPLYTSRRELILHFDDQDGKVALSRYSITGYQKLALRDTVRFSVHGQVNW